jgi:hypothetical protein
MRYLLPVLLLTVGCSTSLAQQKGAIDQRKLEFTIKGCEKDSIYLAGYYGNKLYYNDTAVADAKGHVVFQRAKGYKAGVYAVVVPGPKYFEILVNEPQVVMETDTADLSGHLVVKKSVENQVFLDYVRFINTQRKEADEVNKQREATEDPIKKRLEGAFGRLRESHQGVPGEPDRQEPRHVCGHDRAHEHANGGA